MGKRKRKFESLTPAGKRVRIARDVLEQIALRKVKAKPGTYFEILNVKGFGPEDELRDLLKERQCTACAMGAMFASCILEEDDMDLSEVSNTVYGDSTTRYVQVGRSKMDDRLGQFFSISQLRMIEEAFEVQGFLGEDGWCTRSAAQKFGKRYESPGKRLRAIMQNIIDNRGEFRP